MAKKPHYKTVGKKRLYKTAPDHVTTVPPTLKVGDEIHIRGEPFKIVAAGTAESLKRQAQAKPSGSK